MTKRDCFGIKTAQISLDRLLVSCLNKPVLWAWSSQLGSTRCGRNSHHHRGRERTLRWRAIPKTYKNPDFLRMVLPDTPAPNCGYEAKICAGQFR